MPVKSAIMNTTAPITGGTRLPPVDATASTAPAKTAEYPIFFMIGIFTEPVTMTSAAGLPEIMPNNPLDTTATFDTPPTRRPANSAARLKKKRPPPVSARKLPNRINKKTYAATT